MNLSPWNETRRGAIELDAFARVYIGHAGITDRDRIAFALRELRMRGYEVEGRPVDWTKSLLIYSTVESEFGSFGAPKPSKLYKRLERIAKRSRLITECEFHRLLKALYPEESEEHPLFDHEDFLERPYEFHFKGDPELVEAVFQAVGFATQHGVRVPDDGSETYHHLGVRPPTMLIP